MNFLNHALWLSCRLEALRNRVPLPLPLTRLAPAQRPQPAALHGLARHCWRGFALQLEVGTEPNPL